MPLAIINNDELKAINKSFKNHTVVLETDNKLILYTDGITDTVENNNKNIDSNTEFFGNTRLMKIFLENKEKSAGEFVDIVYNQLVQFRGSDNFDDDVCLICVNIE